MGWFNEMQRLSALARECGAGCSACWRRSTSATCCRKVQTPTLIFHSRDDQAVPFAQGEELAAGIPGAAFVPLESKQPHPARDRAGVGGCSPRSAATFLADGDDRRRRRSMPRKPEPADVIGLCEARDGAGIALCEARRRLSAGQGAELDDASGASTGQPGLRPLGARNASRANRLRPARTCAASACRTGSRRASTSSDLVGDLAAVIDAAGVEQCDLLGMSHGGAIAMAYAARHPERVRKLVLVNGFAAGWRVRADPEEMAWRESLMEMNRRQPASAAACSARCSSRSISRRRARR